MGAQMPPCLRAALSRPQPAEWAIGCPGCHAKPGTPCKRPRGGTVAGGVHPSRADAWLVHQQTGTAA
jgi:hypothetical protein